MVRVLFVCLGNICRSPMAEAVFRHFVDEAGLTDRITIDSAGTSGWNEGRGAHHGTRDKLHAVGISSEGLVSRPLVAGDAAFDYIIGMDEMNIRDIEGIIDVEEAGTIARLLDYTPERGDIADPYYTGDFDVTYRDVLAGCQGLLDYIIQHDLEDRSDE